MKLWNGRFNKEQDKLTDVFNSSLPFDFRMYKQDIQGSIAHAAMLSECKIITEDEGKKIINGLETILDDIENGRLQTENSEDIHMFIESELTKRIDEAGKKLHTARSRNDQVTTDFKLYILECIKEIDNLVIKLINSLGGIALENLETYMPGFTHMQKAQPITLAHYLSAYCEMFKRDHTRLIDCYNRANVLPLGAGALAGTTHNIDRNRVKELLNFSDITLNSLDSVSDRDYALEFLFDCSAIIMHLSRFCEEIITFSSDEYRFFELDDAYSTGSSIMPQKKNPDIAELIRGKSGRIYGNLMALLTVMKGLPLAYNKDMQEDKEAVFDTADTIKICLKIFIPMFETIKFNKEKMQKSAMSGYTNATDAADYLVKKGVPFRTAHHIIGELVNYAIDKDCSLNSLKINEFKKFSENFDNDIYDFISLKTMVENRKSIGGCSPVCVKESINKILNSLKGI